MKKFLKNLQTCPLFLEIAPQDLERMLTCLGAKITRFDKKYSIFTEGHRAKQIGILLNGSAQTVYNDFYGNRSIIHNIRPNELFGEEFACSETAALPVSVIANEPSEVMFIDCDHILHTCQNNCHWHQQLIYNLMKELALKSVLFQEKIEITSKRTTRDKLMAYLMQEAKRQQSDRFEIPFNRQELADYLEVDRSGLSVEIGKLKAEGVLDCEKNRFVLL